MTGQLHRWAAILLVTAVVARGAHPAGAASFASDHAGDPAYADGWQSGDNGGIGFGPWQLNSGGGAIQHPTPHFIDTPPPLAGNRLGSPAFAMTSANMSFSAGDFTGARRTFLVPPLPG